MKIKIFQVKIRGLMKVNIFLLILLFVMSVKGDGKDILLKPAKGYGWTKKVVQSGTLPVYIYIKDSGYKRIILYKSPNVIDINIKQQLIDFWGGFEKHVNVTEIFAKGHEKFLGQDSYFFDLKSENNNEETYTTINIVTFNKIQYIIQRVSTIIDPKKDEEMLTLLTALK